MRIVFSLLYAPIVFFSLSYFDIKLDDALYLKGFPMLISIVITFLMLLSYMKKNSMILYFAQKFSKMSISEKEKEYIHNSTLFWVGVSVLNVFIHGVVFFDTDEVIWVFYSSIGWYFVFGLAFIVQMIHRAIYFKGLKSV